MDRRTLFLFVWFGFGLLGLGIVSAHQLYVRLRRYHPEFAEGSGYIKTPRAVFSYAESLSDLKECYAFSRPFFAFNGSLELTRQSVMANHFLNEESFDIEDCKDYLRTIGIKGNFTFSGFAESVSDDFVLVDRFRMVRKDVFQITQEEIDRIADVLSVIIRIRGQFDSKDMDAMAFLPQTIGGLDLNPYLLLGVVRTFLSDRFNVEAVANQTTIDYVITQ